MPSEKSTMPPPEAPDSEQAGTKVEPRSKGILINRNFMFLTIGQGISNLGDMVYAITLTIWVYALTNSAAAVGGVLVAQSIPTFALGPIAGVFVDRWNRKTTMVIADVARALIVIVPLVVPDAWRLPAIYASVFLASTFSRLFMPAKSGVTQVIVPEKQQPQAASISQALSAIALLIGPALASPLFFLVGPIFAVLINAASFLVSALCVQLIQASKEVLHPYVYGDSRQETTGGGIRPVLRELRDGIAFLLKTRVLVVIIIMGMLAMFGGGAVNTLDIVFVNQNLHTSSEFYGPLAAVGGAGMLLGAIVAGLIARRVEARFMLAGSIFLLGVGIIFYGLQTWFIMALVVSFIMSIPQGGLEVAIGPLLINSTPRTMMGRVMAVFETAMMGASLVSIALTGYLGQIMSVSVIFVACGVLFIISGLFGWFALPPQQSQKQETQIPLPTGEEKEVLV